MTTEHSASTSPRFSLRMLLIGTAFLAILFGWYTSLQRERARGNLYQEQLINARSQVHLAESRAEIQDERPSSKSGRPREGSANVRLDFRNLVIQGGDSAFQNFAFDRYDLSGSSLTGGVASFQGASFNHANLKNTKLFGGVASFQYATFENADLSGAVLSGNLQAASFRNAKCVGVTLAGNFQCVHIGGAQFQQADLSAIDENNLVSCYFDTPPTYDASTKFPAGFDPTAHGWREVSASPQID